MIRLTTIQQSLSLRGTNPELSIIRSIQFMGNGYIPEEHGHIIVMQADDDFSELHEIDSFTERLSKHAFCNRKGKTILIHFSP